MTYKDGSASPNTYYYILNLQGDVMGLTDTSGALVARYTYNAWGELLSITNENEETIPDRYHIAYLNHLRYRGYYYDEETGFYYLQSRYYDPAMHRFINADASASTGQGFIGTNMFAYCNNSPVVLRDSTGNEPTETIDLDGDGEIDCYIYEYQYEAPIIDVFGWYPVTEMRYGKVYIFRNPSPAYLDNPDYIPSGERVFYDVVVTDYTKDNKNNANLQVRNSFCIYEKNQMYAIIDVLLEYGAEYKTNWKRSRKSLYVEWREHNRYAAFSESARHVDFNNADEGNGFFYFLGKAIKRVVD